MRKFLSKGMFLCWCSAVVVVSSFAQVPLDNDTTVAGVLRRAQQWSEAKSYHVARLELARLIRQPLNAEQAHQVLSLLVRSTYEDRDYEEAYQHSVEFLNAYPEDHFAAEVMFMQGVSAFHTRRLQPAVASLTTFLDEHPADEHRAAAYYWRAMSELDLGDQQAAEDDLGRCFDEPVGIPFRDNALMGWALAFERRGEYDQASQKLEQLLSEYPKSDLRTDATIRLASISLRQRNPQKTVDLLQTVDPKIDAQRQEYLLLAAESEFQLGSYERAQHDYESFVKEFPNTGNTRKARFGLGWSRLKHGDNAGARTEFDSLSRGSDSLAYAAMYESGVLFLLDGNTNAAMARFDTLVEKSPYDRYIDQAYVQMGMIRYRAKYYRDARHYFQLAARLYPDGPLCIEANRMMGECSMALNDFSNAQYGFAQVRKLGAQGEALADAMFQEGVALYHLGRFKSSAERFTDYLRQFPRDRRVAEGFVWKGEALYQDGRFDEAERAYTDALKYPDNPRKEDATYGIAWTQFEQKKFTQSAAAFDKFAAAYPNSAHVLDASLRKADSYFFLGQYDKASELYNSLTSLRTDQRTIEYAAFQLAMSYVQRGDADRGIDHLRDFLKKYPQSIYAEVVQFNIGWTYFSREQYKEAIPEFHAVQSRFPESQLMPRVLFNTGDAFFNLKAFDSARVYYQRVIKDFPTSPLASDALAGLQYSYEAEGKPAQAAAEIDTLLNSNKADGIPQEELILRKGDIYFSQADWPSAITAYQRVLSLKPGKAINAKALYQLGRSYELQNNPVRAISYYQQVLTNFGDAENAPAAALAVALAHIKTKQFRAAIVDLHAFDARYPDSPLSTEAHYQLGIAYMGAPEYPAAVTEFQSVIAKPGGDLFADKARLKIAEIHFLKKEYNHSIDTLNALISRRSDDLAADGLVMIGDNQLAMKKYREALQAYNDLIQQYKEFPLQVERAHFGLAKTYEKMNDRKQARLQYQKILESPIDQTIKYESEQRLRKLRK